MSGWSESHCLFDLHFSLLLYATSSFISLTLSLSLSFLLKNDKLYADQVSDYINLVSKYSKKGVKVTQELFFYNSFITKPAFLNHLTCTHAHTHTLLACAPYFTPCLLVL